MDKQREVEPTSDSVGHSLDLAFPGADGFLGGMVYRKDACKFLGVQRQTVLRYEQKGTLQPYKNQVNGKVYYLEANVLAVLGSRLPQAKSVVLYCRSAVLGSRSDVGRSASARLAEQVDRLSSYCVRAGIRVDKVITDIGPGTGKSILKGHDTLIEMVLRKQVSTLIIETPDRLARWGMGEILERFLTWHGVTLHVASPVLSREEYREEIKQDLADIIYDSKHLLGEI